MSSKEVARWEVQGTIVRTYPSPFGDSTGGRYLHDVQVKDGLAYLAYWRDGLVILDVGAGIKGGTSFGETDEIGYKAVVDPVTVHDLHATLLHLLGFDHERLTVRHQGLDQRLTGVESATVTNESLA